MVSNLLRNHPDILSLSEFWPNRVNLRELFSDKIMSGKAYWDLLSVPMAQDIYKVALDGKISQVPNHSLHEQNYMRRVALPSLVEDYDQLFQAIEEFVTVLPEAKPSEHIISIFDFIKDRLGKKVWVERTGASSDFLHRWRRMWPGLRIVHVYRDGRDCAISMSKHHAFRLQIMRAEINEGLSFYKILPISADSFTIEEFYQKEIRLERFGELWNTMIMRTLDEIKMIPEEQCLNIKYEDLISQPDEILSQLLGFISPELEGQSWIEEQKRILSQSRSNWRTLEPMEIERLTKVCRYGLSRLNYL